MKNRIRQGRHDRLGTQRHEILVWPEARADPTSGTQRLVSYLVSTTPSGVTDRVYVRGYAGGTQGIDKQVDDAFGSSPTGRRTASLRTGLQCRILLPLSLSESVHDFLT